MRPLGKCQFDALRKQADTHRPEKLNGHICSTGRGPAGHLSMHFSQWFHPHRYTAWKAFPVCSARTVYRTTTVIRELGRNSSSSPHSVLDSTVEANTITMPTPAAI